MKPDTKKALLDSAERVARARGYDGFSYADLADDVGIRKASIHYHFPSKADLSLSLMQRYAADLAEARTEIEAGSARGGARLNGFLDLYRDALGEGTMLCLCVSFSLSRANLSDAVLAELAGFRAVSIDWLTDTFARGQADGTIAKTGADAATEAAAALALIEGAQIAARAEMDLAIYDRATALLRARLSQ